MNGVTDINGKPFRWEVVAEMAADYRTDKEKGLHHHEMLDSGASANKNFDQKVYMFPDSFTALRQELWENWRDTIWPQVSWSMAFAAGVFVERMNEILDLDVQLDSSRVDYICTVYLNALQKKRGVTIV